MTFDPPARGQCFPCPRCGAQLAYHAATRGLHCAHCGHQQDVAVTPDATAGPREIPLADGMAATARGLGRPVKEIECQECGATIGVEPQVQTVTCLFCRSHKVLLRGAGSNLIRPESVVPFQIDKTTARGAFALWLRYLWFRPDDLERLAQLQEMQGVYVPFWIFKARAHSQWTAEAYGHYAEPGREGSASQIFKTGWRHVSGNRNDVLEDTPICASRGLLKTLVHRFRSWGLSGLVPYEPRFLAGWTVESYAIDLPDAWARAQQDMEHLQRLRCTGDILGTVHRNLQVQSTFSHVTFKHALLPVWIAAYRYRDKAYQLLVNGQTGEVAGQAPWSNWKIALALVLPIAVMLAFLGAEAIYQMIVYW